MPSSPQFPITFQVHTPVITALSDFHADVLVQNNSRSLVRVNTYTQSMPAVCLKIEDARGWTVHHLPPPVGDPVMLIEGLVLFKANTSISFDYTDLAVAESSLPPGTYRIRYIFNAEMDMRPLQVVSDWVEFKRVSPAAL